MSIGRFAIFAGIAIITAIAITDHVPVLAQEALDRGLIS
jgi:hypothetical protein